MQRLAVAVLRVWARVDFGHVSQIPLHFHSCHCSRLFSNAYLSCHGFKCSRVQDGQGDGYQAPKLDTVFNISD